MVEIRFHGRGGQGARLASRIVGRAGFLAALFAQDFSLFGAERRGAPIVSFTRLSREVITRRGYVEEPDAVLVMDDSLIRETHSQVFQGVRNDTPVLVNTHATKVVPPVADLPQVAFVPLNWNGLALRVIGSVSLSAIAAASVAKLIPELTIDILSEAIRIELGEAGLVPELIEKNVLAAGEAFSQMAPLSIPERAAAESRRVESVKLFPLPFYNSTSAGPTILHPGSAALRHTGDWRVETPEIHLDKCKRCFLCFLFCPEAAIALDERNYPHIDFQHCKGCMICYEECPPRAIFRRIEEEAYGA